MAPLQRQVSLHDQMNILPRKKLLVVFSCMALSLFISFIDQNGISVALPSISRELKAEQTISWAGTSSLIANTAFTVLYGRLSDVFGRKVVYMSTLALLGIAALLCGLSQNPAMFYVFRGLAGIGGGGINSLTLIVVSDIVTLQERGKYQGILGAAVGFGNVVGPLVAAGFVQHSTWRGIFYLICPCAFLCVGVAWLWVPGTIPSAGIRKNLGKIDYLGVLTSSTAMIFLLIPISGGGFYFEWQSPLVISFLVLGSCALVLFVLVEWKVAVLPMLPLYFFKDPVITILLVQSFLLGAIYQSNLYYLPLYFQNGRGWSAIQSAIMTLPFVLTMATFSILSGQYMSRIGSHVEVICVGFLIWTIGAGLALLLDSSTSKGVIAAILIPSGIGTGLTLQPTVVGLQSRAAPIDRAAVISNRNFARCAGGAISLAASAAILQATLKANLPDSYKYLSQMPYAFPSQFDDEDAKQSVRDAYVRASNAVFIFLLPLAALCLLGCTVLLRYIKNNTGEEDVKATSANAPVASTGTQQQGLEVKEGDPEMGNEKATRTLGSR